jgi:N-acetylglucosamine-6-sulfatase
MLLRKKRLLLIPLFVLLGLTGLTALTAGRAATRANTRADIRPNIVFILTDDQDLVLNSLSYMPAVRNLIAAQGLSFSNDYVPLSLCCPSRASILTGEHTHNHQVYTLAPPDGGNERYLALGHEETNLGTAMHAAGYRTALLGKYLNGYPRGSDATHVPPGWDEWDVPIFGAAYFEFNYTMNQNGTLVPHGHAPADYLTDVLTVRARQFIRASAAAKAPFFLYLAPYAPHRPSTPAPRHAQLFPGVRVPRTPSFNEADVSDKPSTLRKQPLLTRSDIADLDAQYRLRLQSLQAVDEMVASVVLALRNSGQLDNTYIFFTSDNGYHMGQHRMKSGKYTPYEEDIRVPLLVRGPGVPVGRTVDAFVLNVDFAPTLAELGGATLGTPYDGRSLVPLLGGNLPPDPWRQAVLLEQFTFTEQPEGPDGILEPSENSAADGPVEHPTHLGLRTPKYKYVEYSNQEREYYDLVNDPYELQNLARKIDVKFLDRLSGIVHALGTCAGDTCRRLEAQPMPKPIQISLPTHH